jgi:glutathione synthase/RimK-type ligase-like ATP-grasp enzyme
VIVRSKDELQTAYPRLGPGDIVLGQMALAHQKAVLLVDLMQRGVTCIPSALAQLLSRSKVAQVELLGTYMSPLTCAIRRRKDLLEAINLYGRAKIGAVVSKQEHLHCGHGIRRWDHIEGLYSVCGLDPTAYPFVLQPFKEDFLDVRVIVIGDYHEAYARRNPSSFRGNLSAGGTASPYLLSPLQLDFCQQIMERTNFPYAHIDLQVMEDGSCFLMEMALNGGIRGSRLKGSEVDKLKTRRLEELVRQAAGAQDREMKTLKIY